MNLDPSAPSLLEAYVMDMLLDGDMEPLPALRRQWEHARIVERTVRPDSSLTRIAVPEGIPRIYPRTLALSDVELAFSGGGGSDTATIFIDDGILVDLMIPFPVSGDEEMEYELEAINYITAMFGPREGQLDFDEECDEGRNLPLPVRDWYELADAIQSYIKDEQDR
jgi:hypothetical protein